MVGEIKKIISFIDMMGNTVEVNYPPKRIVSLVPSQTELLFYLGLDEEVVGITKFCVHPEVWFKSKKRVGGTKTVNIAIVKSLQPDLIIANKEENTKEQIEELSESFPTWVSNIQTTDDALHMISEVGRLIGKDKNANCLVNEISHGFESLRHASEENRRKRVVYFIWRKPWMCAGGNTFISSMIEKAGWENVLADMKRYPQVTLEELRNKNIALVLLSSEPYPFKEAHVAEINEMLPFAEVRLVDGEMMSWYGSRMKLAIEYIKGLIS